MLSAVRGMAGLFAGMLGLTACPAQPSAACRDDGDCALEGTPGVCQPSGHCSYPDPTCPSGLSYPVDLPGPLGGTCVPGKGVETDDGTTTDTGTDSNTTLPSETSASTDATTDSDTGTNTTQATDTGNTQTSDTGNTQTTDTGSGTAASTGSDTSTG